MLWWKWWCPQGIREKKVFLYFRCPQILSVSKFLYLSSFFKADAYHFFLSHLSVFSLIWLLIWYSFGKQLTNLVRIVCKVGQINSESEEFFMNTAVFLNGLCVMLFWACVCVCVHACAFFFFFFDRLKFLP